jgi:demethylmenaquinone methyltransferase/2-methoxy-6-polyprenyl-1,4-benzoquinol methylase
MAGAMFRWAAPVFARFARHWGADDAEALATWLRPTVPPGGRLLDLGGGTGHLARLLAERLDCCVTVLDQTHAMLRYAEVMPGVEPVLGDAAAMPFDDASFDAVLVSDALHHFLDPLEAVREMVRVVRPGGGVVVLEIDPRRRGARTVARVERLLGEPGHFFRPGELIRLMREAGIKGESQDQGRASYIFAGRRPRGAGSP